LFVPAHGAEKRTSVVLVLNLSVDLQNAEPL